MTSIHDFEIPLEPTPSKKGKPISIADDNENLPKTLEIHLPSEVVMIMQRIPHGTFVMGSPEGELGKFPFEDQHCVTLTQSYYMGQYPVTQAQWKAVMGNNPSHFQLGDDYPVEMVSWNDAREFCEKLNQLPELSKPEGYSFDLPTEAQWEYACRAGTISSLNNGTNLTSTMGACPNLDKLGWYRNNSQNTTHQVGQKLPNAWGLYDMHGNVWEWCRDGYDNYDGDCIDPFAKGVIETEKMYRGGCYEFSSNFCRSARRANNNCNTRQPKIGFRVALVKVSRQESPW